jgi:Zn-dependent M28 family amino/carboxypeptidase
MIMRLKSKYCFLAILLLNVFLIVLAASPEQPLLLKIAPLSEAALDAVAGAGGTVVQELRSCLLVSAPSAAVPRLQAAGFSLAAIGYPARGESYFLLQSKLTSPLAAQPGNIYCQLLEEGVWLLRTANPDFRDWLVQPFRLKALQLSGIFPGRAGARSVQPGADDEAAPARSLSGSFVRNLVAQVSTDRLRADILALQNFQTRYTTTPQCSAAGDFILGRFQQLGLAAENDLFRFEGTNEGKNVVAVIPGKATPKKVILACAHYDSYSNNRLVFAPGADDNGSGTAAILELARILAAEKFNFSIILLCVSAEEWGLYGSAHYARQARLDGAEIIAVVNLDMIAYPGGQQRVLDVIGNQQSEWLADRFIAIAQPYVGLRLAKVIDPSLTWSDHSSFWDQGYAALCGIEDSDNPYYHRTSDTLETLDLAFATETAQASLAVVAELAQPSSALAAPKGLRAQSQISVSVFTGMKTVYLSWQANLEPLTGYNVFRAEGSGGPYLLLTAQPIFVTAFRDYFLAPGKNYFYVLTAVDDQGRESGYSEEVRDDENN